MHAGSKVAIKKSFRMRASNDPRVAKIKAKAKASRPSKAPKTPASKKRAMFPCLAPAKKGCPRRAPIRMRHIDDLLKPEGAQAPLEDGVCYPVRAALF